MNRYILLILVSFFLFIHEALAQTASPEVIAAAESGLQPLLKHIPSNTPEDFGFSENDKLENVVLGEPLNLHTILPKDVMGYQESEPISSVLSSTLLWYFPVMLDGKPRTVLVVDQVDGEWQAVSLGNTRLAKTLVAITQRWDISKGFNPKLIAIFQAKQYLLAVPEVSTRGLIPISTSTVADRATHVQNDNAAALVFENSFEVLERLKPIISDNMSGNR